MRAGADRAAVDEAYRRLIKLYHPDRQGGDAGRAAEINRAYFELRDKQEQPLEKARPETVAEALYARRASRVRAPSRSVQKPRWGAVLAAAAAVLLYLQRDRAGELANGVTDFVAEAWKPPVAYEAGAGSAVGSDLIDVPLATSAIDSAIEEAVRQMRKGDEEELAEFGRECHRRMRAAPSADMLDRCSAFDNAVVVLQNRDPLFDRGPFSASSVTSRQMAAATLLSDDYIAIEGRLDRIRARVELALSRPAPSSAPPASSGPQPAP